MANAPHITMANAPHITMANAPHITMANAPHITMANAPHITMANAPHIRWRTLHTLRWRTLHTYDGERSMRWGTPVIGDALMTGACEGGAAQRDSRELTAVRATVEAVHSWIVWL